MTSVFDSGSCGNFLAVIGITVRCKYEHPHLNLFNGLASLDKNEKKNHKNAKRMSLYVDESVNGILCLCVRSAGMEHVLCSFTNNTDNVNLT